MLLSFMSGCDRENVGELRRELEELEKQLKVLQSWQEKVNENLKTLQKLLEGLNQGKYVFGHGDVGGLYDYFRSRVRFTNPER